jgi:iron complex outermembrane receptor protein
MVVPTGGPPLEIDFHGNPNIGPERLFAFEGGYRVEPTRGLLFDLATFYNIHTNMDAFPRGGAHFVFPPVPHLLGTSSVYNGLNGSSYGAELAATWKVTEAWKLQGSYSYTGVNLHSTVANNSAAQIAGVEYSTPFHMAQIRSYYDITKDIEFNAAVYANSGIHSQTAAPSIGSLVRMDLNLVWRPWKNAELTAGVRNLLDNRHPEFQDRFSRNTQSEVPRSFFVEFGVGF